MVQVRKQIVMLFGSVLPLTSLKVTRSCTSLTEPAHNIVRY
jgi:hypothetical protein